MTTDLHAPPRTTASRRRILGVSVPLQLFLGAGWLRAGIEKVIDPEWWSGAYLRDFLDEQRPEMLPWFTWFSDRLVEPLAPVVAGAVLSMQLGIGACLLTNRHVKRALWVGILLNVCFTMAGRVNPSAFYLVMQATLLFALSRPIGEVVAVRRAIAWLIPATLIAPFARTLHPARVIDDPALMLSFLCLIAAVTTIAIAVPATRLIGLAERTRVGRWAVSKTTTAGHPGPAIDRFG